MTLISSCHKYINWCNALCSFTGETIGFWGSFSRTSILADARIGLKTKGKQSKSLSSKVFAAIDPKRKWQQYSRQTTYNANKQARLTTIDSLSTTATTISMISKKQARKFFSPRCMKVLSARRKQWLASGRARLLWWAVCKLVPAGPYCACAPADIVPLNGQSMV